MVAKCLIDFALIAAIFASLASQTSGASFLCFGSKETSFEKEYDLIEAHLNENVPSYLDIYAQLDRLSSGADEKTLAFKKSGGKRLASALKQLLSLKSLYLDGSFCTEKGSKLIESNDDSVRNVIQREAAAKEPLELRRVEKIVLHFAKEHARKCLVENRAEFAKLVSEKDENLRLFELSNLIEPLIGAEMVRSKKVANSEEAAELIEKNPTELIEFVFGAKQLDKQAISVSLKKVVVQKIEQVHGPTLPEANGAAKRRESGAMFAKKFDAKLALGCSHHVRRYGDLFEQVTLDYKLIGTFNLLRNTNGQLDESEEAGQFLEAFMLFEACNKLSR